MKASAPQNSASKLKTLENEYSKKYKLWIKRNNTISSVNSEITAIDSHLASLNFKVGVMFNRRSDVDDYATLVKTDNRSLSPQELTLKKQLLQKDLAELIRQADEFANVMQQLKVDIAAVKKHQQASVQHSINTLFNLDPQSYLSGLVVSSDYQNMNDLELFSLANDILLVGDQLAVHASSKQLLNLVQTIISAKDRALKVFAAEQNATNAERYSKYNAGFKNVVNMLVAQDFAGMADILYLNEFGRTAQVKQYLAQADEFSKNGALADLASLIEKVALEAAAAGHEQSLAVLSALPGFKDLSSLQQQVLVAQQQYVARLKFNIKTLKKSDKSLDLTELNEFSEILAQNITSCLAQQQDISVVDDEFQKILDLIEQRKSQLYWVILEKAAAENYQNITVTPASLSALLMIGATIPAMPSLALAAGIGTAVVGVKAANLYVAEQQAPTAKKLDILKDLATKLKREEFKELITEDQFWGVSNGLEKNDFADDLAARKTVAATVADHVRNVAEPLVKEAIEPEVSKFQQKAGNALRTVGGFFLGSSFIGIALWGLVAIAMLSALGTLPPVWPIYVFIATVTVVGVGVRLVYGDKFDSYVNNKFKQLSGVDFKDSKLNRYVVQKITNIFNLVVIEPFKSLYQNMQQAEHKRVFAAVTLTSVLVVAAAVAMPIVAPSLGIIGAASLGIIGGIFAGLNVARFASKFYDKVRATKTDLVRDNFSVPEKTLNKLDLQYKEVLLALLAYCKKRAAELYAEIDQIRNSPNKDNDCKALITKIEKLSSECQKIISLVNDKSKFCIKVDEFLHQSYVTERVNLTERVQVAAQAPEAFSAVNTKGMLNFKFSQSSQTARIKELHNLKEQLDHIKNVNGFS